MTEIEDLRLQIMKAMLNEFPELRERIHKWIEETDKEQTNARAAYPKTYS